MKEVRYNDRIWFGKHKGSRICDLIKHDPNFIQKIVGDGKIQLDNRTKKVFEEIYGIKQKLGHPPRQQNIPMPNVAPAGEIVQQFVHRWLYHDLHTLKINLIFMIRKLYRDGFMAEHITDVFFTKLMRLNFRVNGIIELKIVKNENLLIQNGGVLLYVNSEGEDLGCFDLS